MTAGPSSISGVVSGSALTCPHCGHGKREDMRVYA